MRVEVGDITHPSTWALAVPVSGSLTFGIGLPAHVASAAGPELLEEAKLAPAEFETRRLIKPGDLLEPGMCFGTTSGLLRKRGVRKVYHAVVAKLPGEPSSLHYISPLTRQILDLAISDKMQSLAMPGFGLESLDPVGVARAMVQAVRYKQHLIEIAFVDQNEEFIESVRRFVGME